MKKILRNKHRFILLIILVLAFGLRIVNITWGIDKELPGHSYLPDEPYGYRSAVMIKPFYGELDPGNWALMKATLYYEYIGTVNQIFEATGIKNLVFPSIKDSLSDNFYYTYILGRFFTILISLAIILGIYYLCLLVFKNKSIGLIAAFNYTIFAHEIPFSHVLLGDTLTAFLSLLTVYFSLSAYRKKDNRGLFIAAIFSGLAISSKYTAIAVILPVLVAFYFINLNRFNKINVKKTVFVIFKIFSGFIMGILVGIPSIIFKFNDFIGAIKNLQHYQEMVGGTKDELLPRFIFYFSNIIYNGMGLVFTILILISICYYLVKKYKNKETYIIFSFIFVFYIILSLINRSTTRYTMPLMPFFAAIIGYFIFDIYKKCNYKKFIIGLFTIFYTYNILFLYNFLDAIHQPVVQNQFEEWAEEVALDKAKPEITYVIGYEDGFSYPVKDNYPAYLLPFKFLEQNPNLDIPSRYVLISSYNYRGHRRAGNKAMIQFLDRLDNSNEFKRTTTLKKNYKIPYITNDNAYYSTDLELFFQKYYIYEKV